MKIKYVIILSFALTAISSAQTLLSPRTLASSTDTTSQNSPHPYSQDKSQRNSESGPQDTTNNRDMPPRHDDNPDSSNNHPPKERPNDSNSHDRDPENGQNGKDRMPSQRDGSPSSDQPHGDGKSSPSDVDTTTSKGPRDERPPNDFGDDHNQRDKNRENSDPTQSSSGQTERHHKHKPREKNPSGTPDEQSNNGPIEPSSNNNGPEGNMGKRHDHKRGEHSDNNPTDNQGNPKDRPENESNNNKNDGEKSRERGQDPNQNSNNGKKPQHNDQSEVDGKTEEKQGKQNGFSGKGTTENFDSSNKSGGINFGLIFLVAVLGIVIFVVSKNILGVKDMLLSWKEKIFKRAPSQSNYGSDGSNFRRVNFQDDVEMGETSTFRNG